MGNPIDEVRAPSGVLLIDKPAGPTSHDVVAWVRWGLRTRKVGHCGTLDPAATGLLVVCVGEATKLVEYLSADDKVYRARFLLGRSTTTGDADGETVEVASASGCSARATRALEGMVGPLELAPPAYSAIKVGGVRAHTLARAGEDPGLESRPMRIFSVGDLGVEDCGREATVEATLRVAKGTYIRSIAEHLGRELGLPCHLSNLRRLASGELSVDRALTGLGARPLDSKPGRPPKWRIEWAPADAPPPATREQVEAELRGRLRSVRNCLPHPCIVCADGTRATALSRLSQGQRIALEDPAADALLDGLDEAVKDGREPFFASGIGAHGFPLIVAVRVEIADQPVPHQRLAPVKVLHVPIAQGDEGRARDARSGIDKDAVASQTPGPRNQS